MGRSVNYLNHAEVVLYFPFENEGDDEFLANDLWNDLVCNLQEEIKRKFPSYYYMKDTWGNNETRVILQNSLCQIGISEYCGLVSLSVAPKENIYSETWGEEFAVNHARQIEKGLQKIVDDLGLKRLNRVGTFSNGEAVFQKT